MAVNPNKEDGTPKTPEEIAAEELAIKKEEEKERLKNETAEEKIERLAKEKSDAELAKIKENLDKAYKARDEAEAKLKVKETAEREAELKRLEDEGKHKEAYEQRLKDERMGREAAEKRVVELTRDVEVKTALSILEFRNERASQIAFKEVIDQLVRNDKGEWIHKSGVSLHDFVKSFAADEDQAFLFKPRTNSGAGGQGEPKGGQGDQTKSTSLFAKSQAEVIAMAAAGKFSR
jgi:hypothetical protein